jgi:hypothetical protein
MHSIFLSVILQVNNIYRTVKYDRLLDYISQKTFNDFWEQLNMCIKLRITVCINYITIDNSM